MRIHIHRRDFRLDPNSGGGCLAAPPIIMSCLLWNCRGLGFPLTVQVLRDMICLLNPELVAETRCTPGYVDSLKTQRNVFGLTVDIIGMSGGLALLWRKNVDVSLLSLSPHHIDFEVNQPTGGSRVLRISRTTLVFSFMGFSSTPPCFKKLAMGDRRRF